MTSAFERLCGPGKPLKREPPDAREIAGLRRSALATLRFHGYRATQRYIVFQLLPHTLGLRPEIWRVLSRCHDMRNLADYEGELNVTEALVAELVSICRILAERLDTLIHDASA